jgi:hypothetical protein
VEGHLGNALNKGADKLANEGATNKNPLTVGLETDQSLTVSRIKLLELTQKLTYRAIRENKMRTYKKRARTEINLERVKACAKDTFGRTLTNAILWRSLKSKDLPRQKQTFKWMLLHDAYKVGTHWIDAGNPELQERSQCRVCQITETMEHILTECNAPGQQDLGPSREVSDKKDQGMARDELWGDPR